MTAAASKPVITTRQKIILGVLGTVLAAVLLFPPDKGATNTADAPPEPRRRKSAQDSSAHETNFPIRWPDIALADVLARNPFAKIPVPEPPAVEAAPPEAVAVAPEPPAMTEQESSDEADVLEQRGEAARSLRVSLIIKGEKGPAALIGTRIVHEGDIIEGCRVQSITDAGVIVVPVMEDDDAKP